MTWFLFSKSVPHISQWMNIMNEIGFFFVCIVIENFAYFLDLLFLFKLLFLEFSNEMHHIKKCIVLNKCIVLKKTSVFKKCIVFKRNASCPKETHYAHMIPKNEHIKNARIVWLKCEIYYVPNCDSQLWVTVRKYLTQIVKLVATLPHSLNQLTKRRHNKALSIWAFVNWLYNFCKHVINSTKWCTILMKTH